jgi:hypothetical protein
LVVNLSSQEISEQQIELLRLGLKFTPTPRKNQEELIKDTREFTRKLRLGEFFLDADENDDGSIVKNKSRFIPPRGRNNHLDKYIDYLHAISSAPAPQKKTKSNTSHNLQLALKELQENQNLIIKEADKGGAIVLMDKDYYENKILEMLSSRHRNVQRNTKLYR